MDYLRVRFTCSLALLVEGWTLAASMVLVTDIVTTSLAATIFRMAGSPNLTLRPKVATQEGKHRRLFLAFLLLRPDRHTTRLKERLSKRHASLRGPVGELLILQTQINVFAQRTGRRSAHIKKFTRVKANGVPARPGPAQALKRKITR